MLCPFIEEKAAEALDEISAGAASGALGGGGREGRGEGAGLAEGRADGGCEIPAGNCFLRSPHSFHQKVK